MLSLESLNLRMKSRNKNFSRFWCASQIFLIEPSPCRAIGNNRRLTSVYRSGTRFFSMHHIYMTFIAFVCSDVASSCVLNTQHDIRCVECKCFIDDSTVAVFANKRKTYDLAWHPKCFVCSECKVSIFTKFILIF